MSLPFLSPLSRRFGRIVGATVLLLALSAANLCLATEVKFGPGNKYSLQLPDSWTPPKVQKDGTFGADGPDGLSLNAMIGTTATAPEALMEKIIAGSTQKKAGYKLLEKGPFKSAAGRKVQLHRYQLDGKDGPTVWVDYYFQLAQNEVVVLVFAFPSNIAKSPKSEIETILDSVKVASAASQDESWLNSDATPASRPPAKTAPPSSTSSTTTGTTVTFASNCSVELPPGWTAKPADKHIEATGPEGTRLDGFSELTSTSLDSALTAHLSVFAKMPGYALVDTDSVATEAGAKGKLAYYRYNSNSGPVEEVGVIVEVAKNQLVTLRFLTPKKLDEKFHHAVDAIFSSLKISGTAATRPNAAPRDTPAQKPKLDPKTDEERAYQILDSINLAGTYVSDKRSMTLGADGRFEAKEGGKSFTGTYTSDSGTLRFKDSQGETFSLKREKDALVTPDGERLRKKR
ncbi:MAG: hypothetical protein QOH88_453 [Verrucomicrobiota bacterium]|jgi:hypothetical protein